MIQRIQNLSGLSNAAKPKFGYGAAPQRPFGINTLDFQELGNSTLPQNKIIYTGVIISRLLGSRSWNEFSENIRRDALGCYFWFMGGALMQTGLLFSLAPLLSKASKTMMLTQLNQDMPFHKKAWTLLTSPSKLFLIASDDQLHQRKQQILSMMKKEKVDTKAVKGVEKLFERTINVRALMSAIGLAFTIFMIGIGIIYINIALTRASLRKKKQAPVSQTTGFQAAKPQQATRLNKTH